MRNPALWSAVSDRHHDMFYAKKGKSVRDGGRQYQEDTDVVDIVDGMTLQPWGKNSEAMTPVGPNVTVQWLGFSGPDTAIPMGKTLVDEAGKQYLVQGAQDWGDFWACALQDKGVPVVIG